MASLKARNQFFRNSIGWSLAPIFQGIWKYIEISIFFQANDIIFVGMATCKKNKVLFQVIMSLKYDDEQQAYFY